MGIIRAITQENRKRILRFCAVGLSGVGVNGLVTWFANDIWLDGAGDLVVLNIAKFMGTGVSIFTNFLLNDYWTWGDRKQSPQVGWIFRLIKYYVTASLGAVIEMGVFNLIVYLTNSPAIGFFAGIGFATFTNFAMMHLWVFRSRRPTSEQTQVSR